MTFSLAPGGRTIRKPALLTQMATDWSPDRDSSRGTAEITVKIDHKAICDIVLRETLTDVFGERLPPSRFDFFLSLNYLRSGVAGGSRGNVKSSAISAGTAERSIS